jgi:signal transduction histidine kinase
MPRLRFEGTHRRTELAIIIGFALTVLAFVGVSWASLAAMSQVDAEANSITTDATPSVVQLSSARTEIRHLEVKLADLINARWSRATPEERAATAAILPDLENDLAGYFRLPIYPGETRFWPEIREGEQELHRTLDALASMHSPTEDAAASRILAERVKPSIERFDMALKATLTLDAEQASRLAQEIEIAKRRTTLLAFACGGTAAILALLLLVQVLRVLRRYVQLERARASELDMFSRRVAHDVRSPLGTASLALEMAAKATREPETRKLVDRGRRSLERVKQIVDALYDFAQASAQPQGGASSDAKAVVAGVVEELQAQAAKAGITLKLAVSQGEARTACQPGVLISIASNLVLNAIKFVAERPLRQIAVRLVDRRDEVCLEVEDTGPGIPAERRQLIFEPYVRDPTQANKPGLGLGLATVKRLAETNGGRVGVESKLGEGSTFWVKLPKTSAPRPERPRSADCITAIHEQRPDNEHR